MRVLLDENLPHDLAALLRGHDVDTVAGCGWSGVKNGQLLELAAAHHDALLTMDRSLPREHRMSGLPFATLLILAPSNRMVHLRPLVSQILEALEAVEPGAFVVVGA